MMIDLHTHSFFSDGVLLPAELVRRAQAEGGYTAMAITDHAGPSNLEHLIESLRRFCEAVEGAYGDMVVLPGCELTHVPPSLIPAQIEAARQAGAAIVLVHGETLVEPVAPGTNRAAIEGGADVLAHPGMIDEECVELAAEKGVKLEVSGRKGHSLTNAHVVKLATAAGAQMTFGSDGHAPGDYPTRDFAASILKGAGLDDAGVEAVFANNASFFEGI